MFACTFSAFVSFPPSGSLDVLSCRSVEGTAVFFFLSLAFCRPFFDRGGRIPQAHIRQPDLDIWKNLPRLPPTKSSDHEETFLLSPVLLRPKDHQRDIRPDTAATTGQTRQLRIYKHAVETVKGQMQQEETLQPSQ